MKNGRPENEYPGLVSCILRGIAGELTASGSISKEEGERVFAEYLESVRILPGIDRGAGSGGLTGKSDRVFPPDDKQP
ncbi:MAG: hypothetical protein IKP47_07720 [Ruminococcus sp.]|nr:hypothetical protein [Ruminococcus sp.]